jgi:hypothetical protein
LGAAVYIDSAATDAAAELQNRVIETYPLGKAPEGSARMMSGKAEFRVVLTM